MPATSLENKSGDIPELRLHHVAIIATWRAVTLNKRIKPYLGKGVISEYLFDGSQDFLFWRVCVCEEVTAFYTLISYILKTLSSHRADSSDTYANPVS